jgi:hypothetical protein
MLSNPPRCLEGCRIPGLVLVFSSPNTCPNLSDLSRKAMAQAIPGGISKVLMPPFPILLSFFPPLSRRHNCRLWIAQSTLRQTSCSTPHKGGHFNLGAYLPAASGLGLPVCSSTRDYHPTATSNQSALCACAFACVTPCRNQLKRLDGSASITNLSLHQDNPTLITCRRAKPILMSADLRTALNCLRHPARFMPISRSQLSRVHTGDSIQNILSKQPCVYHPSFCPQPNKKLGNSDTLRRRLNCDCPTWRRP